MSAPVEVEFRATGVDGVQRSLRLVKDEITDVAKRTEGLSHSSLIGFGELARGFAKVGEAGQVGAFAMREFTGAAFRLSEFLGPAGGLIPVLGLATFAVVEFWNAGSEAAKKAREEWQQTLDTLVHGSLATAALTQQHLYSGDPLAGLGGPKEGESSIAFLGRSGGQLALESELARLTPLLAAINKETLNGTTATTAQMLERKSYIKQINEINGLLKEQDFRLAQVTEVTDMLMKKEGELAAFRLQYGPAGHSAGAVGLSGGRFAGGLNTGMFGLSPLLTGEKDYGGKYMQLPKLSAAAIPENYFHDVQLELAKQWEQSSKELSLTMASGIESTFTDVLSDAFTGSFGKIGEDALGGLGGIMEAMGSTLIKYGVAMEGLDAALTNPFTSGIAAIGVGLLLEGLGKALSKSAHSHGGGYGSVGGSVAASAGSISGGGSITIVLPKGMINPADPEWQELLNSSLRKAFGNRNVTIQELS